MPPYAVLCSSPNCQQLAIFKIAACWSDGITRELKTYALCCQNCLARQFQQSLRKQQACRLAPGETLEQPGIYLLARGKRDRQLVRRLDLEKQLSPWTD